MSKIELKLNRNSVGTIIILLIAGIIVYFSSKVWIKRIEELFVLIVLAGLYYGIAKIIKNLYLQVVIGTILVALFGTAISLILKHNADIKGSVATAVGVGSALLIAGLIDKYDSKSAISVIGVVAVIFYLVAISIVCLIV